MSQISYHTFYIDYFRDVHILELDSVGLYSKLATDTNPVVSVTLGVVKRHNRNTHTVLVLKAHQPVTWHIYTKRLRGNLDIIVSSYTSLIKNNIGRRYV